VTTSASTGRSDHVVVDERRRHGADADAPVARRRGRPRAGERVARRKRVLDAALAELLEHGYDQMTMQGVASRAGASKETLYAWFGSRTGLLQALIERSADTSAQRVQAALEDTADPHATLVGYATGLLMLLTSPGSVALNRAAMTSPELAALLLRSGRHRIGPLVERYLTRLAGSGYLDIPDAAAAFQLLYGLVIEDRQIRVLLGEPAPAPAEANAHALTAVDRFLRLTSIQG
jgi:AcrR family transcriptional regulator